MLYKKKNLSLNYIEQLNRSIRHLNCTHTKEKMNKQRTQSPPPSFLINRKCKRGKTAGSRVTEFVRCEWTRTRGTVGGGSIIAMNYNEPVTESDSLRCSSRCSSIKLFFFALLVPKEFESGREQKERRLRSQREAVAYESLEYAS